MQESECKHFELLLKNWLAYTACVSLKIDLKSESQLPEDIQVITNDLLGLAHQQMITYKSLVKVIF